MNCNQLFAQGNSTESALISLSDQILFNLDEDKLSGMVFIDFRKAFDVVDHKLLLMKLRLYRVSDSSLSWFESWSKITVSTYQARGTAR